MTPATIKIFLPEGDAQGLRVGEISNWSGVALAAPRSGLKQLLARPELERSGVYVLLGVDPDTSRAQAYIGEAEVLKARLRQHLEKEFWVQAVVFTSKDEHLNKGHIRYLEARLIQEAQLAGQVGLDNSQAGNARLSESDAADMDVFLDRVRQLLPLLGSNMLVKAEDSPDVAENPRLECHIKGLVAYGRRSSGGFVVYKDSQAVLDLRGSAGNRAKSARNELIDSGSWLREPDCYRFTRDVEFSSPSLAAVAVCGGNTNGLQAWKDRQGRTLKALEEDASESS